MNEVKCLVVSSTLDYSTDLICYELEQRGESFLRINRDRFSQYEIMYSLKENSLRIVIGNQLYVINPDGLKSVYFRAPVFLRTGKSYSLNEQLYRSQWSSFIRNLIIFDKSKWVNHPVSIYKAENKLFQLKKAKEHGLDVPETFVGNETLKTIDLNRRYIVKSLDTALFYEDNKEMFTYTNIITGYELMKSQIQFAPVIIQECLENKTDIRVTFIDKKIFAVKILKGNLTIDGDWRKIEPSQLMYEYIVLPNAVEYKISSLMRDLKLLFGGIDLALVNGTYYFIEVNPTGEWGWLTSKLDIPIDEAIVDSLEGGDFNEESD